MYVLYCKEVKSKKCFLKCVITQRLKCTKKTHTGAGLSRGRWGKMGWIKADGGSPWYHASEATVL